MPVIVCKYSKLHVEKFLRDYTKIPICSLSYSWEWIGLNPNPIGFCHLDSTGMDLIGYGYPFNLDPIGLDLLDRKLEDNPNPIGLVEGNGRTIFAATAGRQRSVAGRRPSGHRPLFFLTRMVHVMVIYTVHE